MHFGLVGGRRIPTRARRARRRVLHARRIARRAPAAVVVLRQLEVVALPLYRRHDVHSPQTVSLADSLNRRMDYRAARPSFPPGVGFKRHGDENPVDTRRRAPYLALPMVCIGTT